MSGPFGCHVARPPLELSEISDGASAFVSQLNSPSRLFIISLREGVRDDAACSRQTNKPRTGLRRSKRSGLGMTKKGGGRSIHWTRAELHAEAKRRKLLLTFVTNDGKRRYKTMNALFKEMGPSVSSQRKSKAAGGKPAEIEAFKGSWIRGDLSKVDSDRLWGKALSNAIWSYTGDSLPFTTYARKGIETVPGIGGMYKTLQEHLAKAAPLRTATVLYRGFAPNKAADSAALGSTYHDPISGWSRDPRVSMKFIKRGNKSTCCLSRLTLPKGTRVLDTMTDEHELLVGPTTFRVDRISEQQLPEAWSTGTNQVTVGGPSMRRAIERNPVKVFDLSVVRNQKKIPA